MKSNIAQSTYNANNSIVSDAQDSDTIAGKAKRNQRMSAALAKDPKAKGFMAKKKTGVSSPNAPTSARDYYRQILGRS
tara:strand:- start:19813 stop:20046 length:234 start_codon:yes stop_codon:yes gene_type:complete